MFRKLFRDRESGEEHLFWRYYSDGTLHYYEDVSLTREVDISGFDELKEVSSVVNIPTPYQLFGIECERGWYPLLQPVIDYIDDYNKDKSRNDMIYVTQIKEKYGTLRVYVNQYTKELADLIEEAEKKSEKICEFCGSEKNVGSTLGWYITICHDCLKKRCKERDESVKWHSYSDGKVYWVNQDKDDEYAETFNEYEEDLP